MALSSHDRIAAVHAVFGCLAGLVIIPSAILVARLGRGTSWWLRVHALLNSTAVLLIIVTFGLGMAAVATADEGIQFSGEGSDLHHQLGLAVFILVLLQALLGLYAHYSKSSKARLAQSGSGNESDRGRGRSRTRMTHIGLGIFTVGLLYWLIWDGLHTEWMGMSTDGSMTPESVQIIFWLLVLFPIARYSFKVGNDVLSRLETKRV